MPQLISQSWATTSTHNVALPASLRDPKLSHCNEERQTQWWAHARSFITKWCFARDGDACKQRTRHFRTTARGHIRHWWILWTAAALSFVGSAWLKAGAEQNARFPRLSSKYLEWLIFFFRIFISRYWRYSVKMRLSFFTKIQKEQPHQSRNDSH